ncbi:MAG: arsenate reductase ArsC [Firmicutes bacterium]|nr:arsenate reductase ArsC [Bacillota bacterium]
MKRILFLCTGNSCRSQMAEGYANYQGNGLFEAQSAGVKPSAINPYAVQVMKEAGIDISGQTVNKPEDFAHIDFDYVITLCDHARESCPAIFSRKPLVRLHWGLQDPALFEGTEEEKLIFFRQIRDEISEKIKELMQISENG